MKPIYATLVAALTVGCGSSEPEALPPFGNVLLHVDTDAPLSPGPGITPAADAATPLFDRLSAEIFAPGEDIPCVGCTRELVLDDEVLRAGGSFAVQPSAPAKGIRVRLRMFRSAGRIDGAPAPEATVEAVVGLPDVAAEGTIDASIFLATDSIGHPVGTLDAPVPASAGLPGPSRAGSWRGARRVDCAEPPGEGEVCVPGGAFWMGSPLADGASAFTATRQRLVVVSPFYLDARETTVASFRAAGGSALGGVSNWSGTSNGDAFADWCTYTKEPDPARDALPLSCVSWTAAHAYCQSRGADLATEAQYEYVAGGLASHVYVWGFDPPACPDAVWGRAQTTIPGFDFACDTTLPEGDIGGPLPLPADADPATLSAPRLRDWVTLPTGTVFDLAGNLEEWMLDRHNREDEPCWNHPESNVFLDPVCDAVGIDGDLRSVRGGAWADTAVPLRVASHAAQAPSAKSLAAGIRCARAAAPASTAR